MSAPSIVEPPPTINPDATLTSEGFSNTAKEELERAFAAKSSGTPAAPPAEPAAPAPTPPAPPVKPTLPATPPANPKPPEKFEAGKTKAADWDALRTDRDTWRTKAEDYEKKYSGVDPAATTALQKRLEQAESILKRVAIERDPEFNQQFTQAVDSARSEMLTAVGADKSALVDRIAKPTSAADRNLAIKELVKEMEPFQQTMFGIALAKLDGVQRDRDAKVAQSQANWDQLQQEQQRQQAAHRERETAVMNQAFDSQLKEWSDPEKGLAFLRPIDGNAEHNAQVDSTIALARRIYSGGLEPAELSKAAIYAALSPVLLQNLYALQNSYAELKAERDKLAGTSPGAAGGTSQSQSAAPPDENLDYGQAVGAAIRAAGVTFGQRG